MKLFDARSYERLWKRIQDDDERALSIRIARTAMWGLVPVFHAASLAKRAVFELGLFPKTRLPALTVSVGNITMGGTGKTTMVRLIADLLTKTMGLETAVLCRGYRSSSKETVLPVSRRGKRLEEPGRVGDEAWLLAGWLDRASVVLGRRRAVSGRWAVENLSVQAIVLDDGFQYWRLVRDIDIVCVSALYGFGNGYLFPRGPLREPLRGLKRARVIVIYRSSGQNVEELEAGIRSINPDALYIRADTAADNNFRTIAPGTDTTPVCGARVFAFCGLGYPGAFISTLRAGGARVTGYEFFNDHHVYSEADIAALKARALRAGADILVTTEKDEANLVSLSSGGLEDFYVLPIKAFVEPDVLESLKTLFSEGLDRYQDKAVGR